ncbi:MAG: methyltransferase domain-containing protein [Gemmatimonadales bacterium]|nr:methyltransferase domain-containing protein [Gemmatimonadales bacterium]
MRAVRSVAAELATLADSARGVTVLEVGAGTGRYAEAVLHGVSERGLRYHGVACDAIQEMLHGGTGHRTLATGSIDRAVGLAEFLPFAAGSFDGVLSFNAVHHFDLRSFLAEAARVLRAGGRLIVYTRTPEQNERTIWGQFFPHFAERETRLYTERTLRAALEAASRFEAVELREMPWTMGTTLPRLLDHGRSGGYSTFRFYSPDEFEEALSAFEIRVRATFDDPSAITAQNDHLLVVATRR